MNFFKERKAPHTHTHTASLTIDTLPTDTHTALTSAPSPSSPTPKSPSPPSLVIVCIDAFQRRDPLRCCSPPRLTAVGGGGGGQSEMKTQTLHGSAGLCWSLNRYFLCKIEGEAEGNRRRDGERERRSLTGGVRREEVTDQSHCMISPPTPPRLSSKPLVTLPVITV